jgi:3-dehydroquinate synthase
MHNILEIKSSISDYRLGFANSLSEIEQLIDQPNTITFIDNNVSILYPSLNRADSVKIKSEESIKDYEGVQEVLKRLTNLKANIQTKLLVIGGGIVQDLVSFCASIYCRGIEYTLIPTTLLAQADSCIGGKTSINFNGRKNILGTFYPPKNIIILPDFIKTLDNIDYISGMGELYKFFILQNNIKDFDSYNNIKDMIEGGLKYKISILARDEFDKGDRRFLNYGHTFGHALEASSSHKIPHGIAVILGSMIATRIAYLLGYSIPDYDIIIQKGIELINLSSIKIEEVWFDFNHLIDITKSDKKSTGKLTMVLVDNKPFLENIENMSIVKEALKATYESI